MPELQLSHIAAELGLDPSQLGVVLIDHGSRRSESNELLNDVAALFARTSGHALVEPAHMELAEPTLRDAFDRCVARGATFVVVFPYFLGPGRHWDDDIPRLAREAAQPHPTIRYLVAAPLGLDERITQVIRDRIAACLERVLRSGEACGACRDGEGCAKNSGYE